MIKIGEDHAIDADERQFILKQQRIVKITDDAGEPTGETRAVWDVLGYYPTIATLIRGLSDRRLYGAVKRCERLKSVQEDLVDWAERLKTPLVGDLKRLIKAGEKA